MVADIHGSETIMNKLLNSPKFYRVKHVVVAGDLTGKVLTPIVEAPNGRYRVELFGERKEVDSSKLEQIKKELRSAGYYYKVVSQNEFEEMRAQPSKIKQSFIEAMQESLDQFFAKAETRLRAEGAKAYLIPGNDDYDEVAEYVRRNAPSSLVPFDRDAVELGNLHLAGYGYSNITPWRSPREKSEPEIQSDLNQLSKRVEPSSTILVSHVPPHGTKIDKAPKLTPDYRQVTEGGEPVQVSVGSTSVRNALEEHGYALGIHGHIHESAGTDFVLTRSEGRKITVLNPGSEYGSGVLRGVVVEMKNFELKSHLFTRG